MTKRKVLIMVGNDVACHMAWTEVERMKDVHNAILKGSFVLIPEDNLDVEPGWSWDGTKFNPPAEIV